MYLVAGFRGEKPADLPDPDSTPSTKKAQVLSDSAETGETTAAGAGAEGEVSAGARVEAAGARVVGGLRRGVSTVVQAVGKINL